MKVRYEMLSDDAVALAVHHFDTSPQHKRTRLLIQLGLPLVAFGLLAATLHSTFGIVAGGVFALSYSIRIPLVMRRKCEKQALKMVSQESGRRALGPHVLSVEPEKITLESSQGRASFQRSFVQRVVDTAQHVFIHVAGTILVVPKRTLETSQVEELLGALRPAG